MNPILVVVLAKGRQFFLKTAYIPKEDVVEEFTTNRPYHAAPLLYRG
ncbi:MAG: hypothetical protein ABFS45_22750 [Pseudomonadota bacterium]